MRSQYRPSIRFISPIPITNSTHPPPVITKVHPKNINRNRQHKRCTYFQKRFLFPTAKIDAFSMEKYRKTSNEQRTKEDKRKSATEQIFPVNLKNNNNVVCWTIAETLIF